MSTRSSWIFAGWMVLPVMSMASVAHGEPAATEVPPHPLVVATETLYQRGLPEACDELVKLSSLSPGLTDEDFVRLQLVAALRSSDEGNELAARESLGQALQVDRSAQPPAFASTRFRKMLQGARAKVPARAPSRDKGIQLAEARKAASEREPVPQALLGAVDALYAAMQIEGAGVVNDLARSWTPLSATDRVQVDLRQGILRMESGDETSARAAFQAALEADREARLPDYTPPKTLRAFLEVKAVTVPLAVAPIQQPASLAAPITAAAAIPLAGKPPPDNSRTWGLAVGGTGLALVAGGVVAGVVALSAVKGQQSASSAGDWEAYSRNRDTAKAAVNVADGLYGVGAIGMGVGAFLFFRAPGEVTVGAGAGSGKASLVVGGVFQ